MDIKDVESLAELARLELKDEEKQALLSDLDGVLAYVKVIEQADANDVDVIPELYNVWREDLLMQMNEEESKTSLDLIKKQFPDSQDGFLKVKKIL